MRLINADNITYESIDSSDAVREEIKSGCGILAVRKEDIDVMPTIEERKTGRWIDCTSSDHWKCSECGDRAPMYWDANRQEYDEWHSPYCPNCGADMRGDKQ